MKRPRPYVRHVKRISDPDAWPTFRATIVTDSGLRQYTFRLIDTRQAAWVAEQFRKTFTCSEKAGTVAEVK